MLGAAAYAAAELAVTLTLGRFFDWGRAEALLFYAFRPWLLLLTVCWAARRAAAERIIFYALALVLAGCAETILLLALGADNPWPSMARGMLAGAALLLIMDLALQGVRRWMGRKWTIAAAVALGVLLLTPWASRGYEVLLIDSRPAEAAERPGLMLMTGLPIIWGEKGAFDPESRPAAAYRALQAEYDVRPLDVLDEQSLGQGGLLLLAQPRALAPAELVALDAWVRGGGKALILTDPVLVWPSELALSDIRRPPPVGLLGPLLTHWGLRLEASEMRGLSVTLNETRGEARRLAVAAPGLFESRSDACVTDWDGLRARCEIGDGAAILLADADLLRDQLWAAPGTRGDERHRRFSDNPLIVADLLDDLAGIERARIAGEVEWLAPDAAQTSALLPAMVPIMLTVGAALILRRKRDR